MIGIIVLLTSIVNAFNHSKRVSLSYQKCMSQPTLINLHPYKYSQEFHYSPFVVKLDTYVGSYNAHNDLSNKVCVPNTTEDLHRSVFSMITGINESKILTKHISSEYKFNFDGRKCNSDRWWNNDKFRCGCKKCHVCENDYVWNPATCSCEKGKYLASIMDVSASICDEIIESYDEDKKAKSYDETKTIPTNFNEKKTTCKTQNFYILLSFLLITVTLLIAVSIYCYLKKYQAKQKHLLPFHFTNNELKEIIYYKYK